MKLWAPGTRQIKSRAFTAWMHSALGPVYCHKDTVKQHRTAPNHCKTSGDNAEHRCRENMLEMVKMGSGSAARAERHPSLRVKLMTLLITWEQSSRCREAKKKQKCWEFQFPLDLNHLIKPEICSAFQTLSSGLQHYARWHQMIKHVQTKSLLSSAPCCLWESPKPADITHLILSALVLQVYLFPRMMKYLLIPEKYYAV